MFPDFILAAKGRFAIGLAFISCLTGPLRAEVSVVGAYSNRIVADKNAQGYGIELWNDGDRYFGFFLNSAGMNEDMPLGVMEDLRYDPATHVLVFKAKLSVGRTTVDGESWVPTRDVYHFEGTLFPDQISGDLIHIDAMQTDRPATHEAVKLYRAREEEASLPKFKSFEQWSELARKLMAARGPQW
jgi:hypothetical protein